MVYCCQWTVISVCYKRFIDISIYYCFLLLLDCELCCVGHAFQGHPRRIYQKLIGFLLDSHLELYKFKLIENV